MKSKRRATFLHPVDTQVPEYIIGRGGLRIHLPSMELAHRRVARELDNIAAANAWANEREPWECA
jgi:hypothetical protein